MNGEGAEHTSSNYTLSLALSIPYLAQTLPPTVTFLCRVRAVNWNSNNGSAETLQTLKYSAQIFMLKAAAG